MNPNAICLVSKQTQKQIFDLIPYLQKQWEVIWKGEIALNGKSIPKGIVIVSAHFIIVLKKSAFKKLNMLTSIHHFLLTGFEVNDDDQVTIKTGAETIFLKGNLALQVARIAYRNYMFSSCFRNSKKPLEIISSHPLYLPQFNPSLSPSQKFQFCYYANCSFYQEKYYHSIVQAIHTTLVTANPIIDFSIMPLSCFDLSHSHKISFTPLFATLTECPYFTGIVCNDVVKPNIIKACSKMLANNETISILSLRNCSITKGGKRLANAINSNQNIGLRYIDLSKNQMIDIGEFVKSLSHLKSKPFYLNLNENPLNEESTATLIRSIKENQNLRGLTHILANKATFTSEILIDFANYIKSLPEAHNVLTCLDLGSLKNGSGKLFKALANKQTPIERLIIEGSQFDPDSFKHFRIFLSNAPQLRELDISNTNLSITQIGVIINMIESNKSMDIIKLHLNSMELNGPKLEQFVGFFNEKSIYPKWEGLGLENNGMKKADLQLLFPLFQKMINLSWVNLSGNFTSSMKGIDAELANLLSIPRLSFLALRGLYNKELNENTLNKFFKKLAASDLSIMLDIRFNNISDDGLKTISELIIQNKFKSLSVDSSKIKRVTSIIDFYKSIPQSKSLLKLDFPIDEKYKQIASQTKKNRKKNLEEIDAARYYSKIAVLANQTSIGFHSNLSFNYIPELDHLIDSSLMKLNQLLQLKSAHHFSHSPITETFGLPYPFQKSNEPASNANCNQTANLLNNNEIASIYGINQPLIIEENKLYNIQFNSLCMRRPGAETSFMIPKEISEMLLNSLRSLTQSYSSRGAIQSSTAEDAHTAPINVNPALNSFASQIKEVQRGVNTQSKVTPNDKPEDETSLSSTSDIDLTNSTGTFTLQNTSWRNFLIRAKPRDISDEPTESDTSSVIRVQQSSSIAESESVVADDQQNSEKASENPDDLKEPDSKDQYLQESGKQSESSTSH